MGVGSGFLSFFLSLVLSFLALSPSTCTSLLFPSVVTSFMPSQSQAMLAVFGNESQDFPPTFLYYPLDGAPLSLPCPANKTLFQLQGRVVASCSIPPLHIPFTILPSHRGRYNAAQMPLGRRKTLHHNPWPHNISRLTEACLNGSK